LIQVLLYQELAHLVLLDYSPGSLVGNVAIPSRRVKSNTNCRRRSPE